MYDTPDDEAHTNLCHDLNYTMVDGVPVLTDPIQS
jgi:hypothetical protein